MVTHTYNPCYSEGRDWEDNGSRPAQADSSKTPSQPIKAGHGGSRKKKKAGHDGSCLSSQLHRKHKQEDMDQT
jgi:hypothetical protein